MQIEEHTTPQKQRVPLVTRADVSINLSRLAGRPEKSKNNSFSPLNSSSPELKRQHLDEMEESENDLSRFVPGQKEAVVLDAILTRSSGMKTSDKHMNFS